MRFCYRFGQGDCEWLFACELSLGGGLWLVLVFRVVWSVCVLVWVLVLVIR